MAGGLECNNPERVGSTPTGIVSNASAGHVQEDDFVAYGRHVLGDGSGEVFVQGNGDYVFLLLAVIHGWFQPRGPRPRRGLLQHCVEPNLQEPG